MTWIITSDQVNPPGDAAITYGITNAGGVFNLRSTGTVDYEIEWGDGAVEISTLTTLPHTYTAGDYDLVVYSDGVYRPFFTNVTADANQITSVVIGPGANLGTSLESAWYGASNMTSFACPFDVTSGVTSFTRAWHSCNSLTSFPLVNSSSVTAFSNAWRGCSSLTSFPSLDTSSGVAFNRAWTACNSLTSFPLLDISSGADFRFSWSGCSSLANFPANMFDTTGALGAFDGAWLNCALTAQSIENILVSLDTNGQSNINLSINGGTNAPRYQGTSGTTLNWSAAAEQAFNNLETKGWTISYNSYA